MPPSAPDPDPRSGRGRQDTAASVVVLGVDPGLRVTGCGVVRVTGSALELLYFGVIRPSGSLPEQLGAIHDGICNVIGTHGAEELAIEQPFVALNTKSAFAIGEARAAAILAAAHTGITVDQYTPAVVKQAVTGYGRGSKDQVGEMVRLQFGLAKAPSPADASDAIAIALCHIAHRRTAALAREALRR